MKFSFYDGQTDAWNARGVDCGDGVDYIKISFSNGSTWRCIKATVYADGVPVGLGMLANANDTDTACFEIESICGKHDISIRTKERTNIHEIELLKFEDKKEAPMSYEYADISPTSWEAVDMLGRHICSAEEVGERRDGKKVGIFYWTWRDAHVNRRPINLTKLLAQYPEAEYDPDHPAWGGDDNLQCHWNEPGMGFYLNSDPYVLRKHAVMLADAEIDFVVFDCTNGNFLWKDGYEPLLREFSRARGDGIRAPQVAFMLNFAAMPFTEDMLRALYQDLYRPGKYEDLWFRVNGKPLIMAYPESLPKVGVCDKDTQILNEIREFFTFRPGQPLYYSGPRQNDQWGWLEMAPQNRYVTREDGGCEMMTVGVAQNAREGRICTYFNDKGTFGRSYTHKDGHEKLTPDSYKYGYNFEEQWENAIKGDPDIVFITGWNEWQMGRCHDGWILEPDSTQIAFVDQYDRERSRDIEPDIDGYLDTYYLQMVSNIRKFKGAPARVKPSKEKSIDISDRSAWVDVLPNYVNTRGATNRDFRGYAGCYYKNDSARNEIISAKVARDDENIYFYVECADKLTAPCGNGWMTLFLDCDRDKKTGWEGYEFVINRVSPENGKTLVEANIGSFEWQAVGEADIFVGDRYLVIKADRKLLGLDKALEFEFKWSDNMQKPEIMDFYYNGDCAPHGRFNYLYKE